MFEKIGNFVVEHKIQFIEGGAIILGAAVAVAIVALTGNTPEEDEEAMGIATDAETPEQ